MDGKSNNYRGAKKKARRKNFFIRIHVFPKPVRPVECPSLCTPGRGIGRQTFLNRTQTKFGGGHPSWVPASLGRTFEVLKMCGKRPSGETATDGETARNRLRARTKTQRLSLAFDRRDPRMSMKPTVAIQTPAHVQTHWVSVVKTCAVLSVPERLGAVSVPH